MKLFYTQNNIGKAKYTVNMHDGVQTHKDGSPFFGIAIFKNIKKFNSYIKDLKKDNYTETNSFDSAFALLKKNWIETEVSGNKILFHYDSELDLPCDTLHIENEIENGITEGELCFTTETNVNIYGYWKIK